MKLKKLCFVMAIVLAFSLCLIGCSDGPAKESGNGTGTDNAAETPTTFGVTDTAVFDTMKITANEMKESDGVDFFTPEDGNVFVGVEFTIENTSSSDVNISSLIQFTSYADGEKCDYSISAACAFDDGTLDGTVSPGKKLTGWYAVEIPEDWEELEIQFVDNPFSDSDDAAKFIFTK